MTATGTPAMLSLPRGTRARNTRTIARRTLLQIVRTPQALIGLLATPVLFLLFFRYVFGGAIPVPGLSYVDFVVPAFVAQVPIYNGFVTAVALAVDAGSGLVERLRSLPMASSAVFVGRAFADVLRDGFVVLATAGVGVAIGFRIHTGPLQALAALGLLLVFSFAFFWVFATVGFATKNASTAQALTTPFFILAFASTAFIPLETLPGWLRAFARYQPVSQLIDAVRGLTEGAPAQAISGRTTAFSVTATLIWCAAITVVFAPLALRSFRRL